MAVSCGCDPVPGSSLSDILPDPLVTSLLGLVPALAGGVATSGDTDNVRAIPVDIKETEKTYIIAADIPGVPKDRVKVNVSQDVLTIAVEPPPEDQEKDEKVIVHRKERSQRFAPRRIRLPADADTKNIKAQLINGTLTLIIPKDEEKTKQHTVPVQ